MSPTTIEVNGTLTADGTLVLDEKPSLPAGRMRITMQQVVEPLFPKDDAISVLQRIHERQRERGYVPPSIELLDAEIAAMRREDDERMQGIEKLQEDCLRRQSGSFAGEGS